MTEDDVRSEGSAFSYAALLLLQSWQVNPECSASALPTTSWWRVWEHNGNINPAAIRLRLCGAGALARVPPGRILRSFAPPGRRGRLPLRDSRADTVFTALYTARVSSTLATLSRETGLMAT